MKSITLIFILLCITYFTSFTQVGIGVASPDVSAALDINSTTQGLLMPRLTDSEILALVDPATGLFIFNITHNKLMVNTGTPSVPVWYEMLIKPAGVLSHPSFTNSQVGNDINGEAAGDNCGASISLSANGTRLAVGAEFHDGNGTDSGHVRVFEWNGSAWNQLGNDIDGEAAGDNSGRGISLSADGNIIAIGAIRNTGNGTDSGHVRIYNWNGSTWNQLGNDIEAEAASNLFGFAVSLSADGTLLAVGAPFNSENGTSAGHVRVFSWNGSAWNQLGTDIDGETAGNNFGWAVSLSSNGNRVAIGAPKNSDNGTVAGHTRIFDWDGITWNQLGNDIDGLYVGDNSGTAVSISSDGSIVAIGAPQTTGVGPATGYVRIFKWDGTTWIQLGNTIEGEATNNTSGSSISLSGNGIRLAIGAIFNNRSTGHVRMYSWTGNAWVQDGSDIDGEAPDDQSGAGVSLSSDGTKVAVGARYNDGNGTDSGHVRVYQ